MEGRYAGLNAGVNEQLTGGKPGGKPRLVHQPELMMMGVEVQLTPGQTVQPGSTNLAQIWRRFLAEQMLSDIPDAVNPQILHGLYTDYTDHSNPSLIQHHRSRSPFPNLSSTVLIVATEVSSIDNPPEGMVGLVIPAARYLMFGPVNGESTARQTWQQVGDYFAADGAYSRAYTIDFERHESGQISVYVAVQ